MISLGNRDDGADIPICTPPPPHFLKHQWQQAEEDKAQDDDWEKLTNEQTFLKYVWKPERVEMTFEMKQWVELASTLFPGSEDICPVKPPRNSEFRISWRPSVGKGNEADTGLLIMIFYGIIVPVCVATPYPAQSPDGWHSLRGKHHKAIL